MTRQCKKENKLNNKYGCPEVPGSRVFYPPLQQIVDSKPTKPGRVLKRIDSPVRMSEAERVKVYEVIEDGE